ncbi:adenylate/guanylate cyclase domain-containing protein [Isosphaera pallida]|nr:adenylate/guanylate cyclase domain-containing protein [Isosphaera pallida]
MSACAFWCYDYGFIKILYQFFCVLSDNWAELLTGGRMSSSFLHVLVTDITTEGYQSRHEADYHGVLELGRQKNNLERLFEPRVLTPGRTRLVIAEMGKSEISRHQAEVRTLPESKVEVRNISPQAVLHLGNGQALPPGQSHIDSHSLVIRVGNQRVIHFDVIDPDDDSLESLPEATLAPGSSLQSRERSERLGLIRANRDGGESPIEAILSRLQLAVDALQTDAENPNYYDFMAKSLVEIVGLDIGGVLFFDTMSGNWQVQSQHIRSQLAGCSELTPSRRVMSHVLARKQTFIYNHGDDLASLSESMVRIERVVAAPILDKNQQVIGALYGERRQRLGGVVPFPTISKADALIVELLAMGVAGGLERIKFQKEKIKLEKEKFQALYAFEQFFTKSLAEKLIQNPSLMDGRECEVTVLFCDIRGFSRESEHLGPLKTVEWVRSVMDKLSACVQDYDGVLIDFIGDELVAMWGAPDHQENHAELACQAAQAMIESLPELRDSCQKFGLSKPMDLGVGINSGYAHVGNTGSSRRFKYGPLGNTVNIASRIQNLNKILRTQLLLTAETRKRINSIALARRVGEFRLANLSESVQVYEMLVPQHNNLNECSSDQIHQRQDEIIKDYEKALEDFENAKFRDSVRRLNEVLTRFENDGPTLFLLSEAIRHLQSDTDPKLFNKVFEGNRK